MEQPSWLTIVRHPLDLMFSHYGVCINGTVKNPDFKGQMCNKKYRLQGEDAFEPSLQKCMAKTLAGMGPHDDVLPARPGVFGK